MVIRIPTGRISSLLINGQTITYDEIGNPLSYDGYTYDWDNGRELKSIAGNGLTASYTYDENGLRVTKTVNGTKTCYEYVGGKLLYEKKGTTELHYFYDINGSLKGIQTVNSNGTTTTFYVVTNTRGDVTQIYDVAGVLQVLYTYDAWGKILSIKDGNGNEITSDTNIGKLNSLRYRSYYFDTETGLFYVGSRYYNPDWGRFINADDVTTLTATPMDLTDKNLFAYCDNNPIMRSDYGGNFWQLAIPLFATNPVGMTILVGVALVSVAVIVYRYVDHYSKSNIRIRLKRAENTEQLPNIKYPGNDPTKSPGKDWQWKGEQGSSQGNYTNPKTGEFLHPDLGHSTEGKGIGRHWDYKSPDGKWYRIFPDGKIQPK